MDEKRKNQLFYLVLILVVATIHVLWGGIIFSFLGRTVLNWCVFVILLVFLGDAISCLVYNSDIKESRYLKYLIFGSSSHDENNEIDQSEIEGEAIPPAYTDKE